MERLEILEKEPCLSGINGNIGGIIPIGQIFHEDPDSSKLLVVGSNPAGGADVGVKYTSMS